MTMETGSARRSSPHQHPIITSSAFHPLLISTSSPPPHHLLINSYPLFTISLLPLHRSHRRMGARQTDAQSQTTRPHRYMAPEVTNSTTYGKKVDVFSYGI